MVLSNLDYLTIHNESEAKCIVMEWKTFVKGEPFRTGLSKGLDELKAAQYKHWLADLRKMKAIPIEDQEWSNQEWFPKALQAGIEKMAILESDNIFNQIAVGNIMSKVPNTALTVRYFNKKEDALHWLGSKE